MATVVTCANCHHRRTFHKKVDGNEWCSVRYCACKEFIEQDIPFNRVEIHKALDKLLDEHLEPKSE